MSCGFWRQNQVSHAGISNCIPQNTMGCNYLSLPERYLLSSGTKVLSYGMFSWVEILNKMGCVILCVQINGRCLSHRNLITVRILFYFKCIILFTHILYLIVLPVFTLNATLNYMVSIVNQNPEQDGSARTSELRGPFYWNRFTLIPAWISNHMSSNVWNEIAHPFPNFNGCTVEVWE